MIDFQNKNQQQEKKKQKVTFQLKIFSAEGQLGANAPVGLFLFFSFFFSGGGVGVEC